MGFLGDIALKCAARVTQFSATLPGAGNDLFTPISPNNAISFLVIYCCFSTSGVLSIARTEGGTTLIETLNSGQALVAGSAYMFTFPVMRNQTVSLRYSNTGTTNCLIVAEQTGTAG